MSPHWAIRVKRQGIEGLSSLRRLPGIEVLDLGSDVWLRGKEPDEVLWRHLLGLPHAELFTLLDDGQLIPHGCRVPQGRLPEGTWQALSRWLGVKLEPAALAGRLTDVVALRLVPSTIEHPAAVLVTSSEAWTTFAQEAPQVRLSCLRFARGTSSDVVIRGTPLPPLPGRRYCESDGIAIEAGWAWSPSVEAKVLSRLFKLSANALVLLHADGTWDHLRADDFVAASRSAARLTAGEAHP